MVLCYLRRDFHHFLGQSICGYLNVKLRWKSGQISVCSRYAFIAFSDYSGCWFTENCQGNIRHAKSIRHKHTETIFKPGMFWWVKSAPTATHRPSEDPETTPKPMIRSRCKNSANGKYRNLRGSTDNTRATRHEVEPKKFWWWQMHSIGHRSEPQERVFRSDRFCGWNSIRCRCACENVCVWLAIPELGLNQSTFVVMCGHSSNCMPFRLRSNAWMSGK